MSLTDRLKNPNPEDVIDALQQSEGISRRTLGKGFLATLAAAVLGYKAHVADLSPDEIMALEALGCWKSMIPAAEYDFPGTNVFGGAPFDYFVRAGAPATAAAFTGGANPYVQNNGVLTMDGGHGSYDLFGMNEMDGAIEP